MKNEENYPNKFKAGYFLRILKGEYNPFNPTVIIIDKDFLEIKKRNNFLISVDTDSYHWEDLDAITIDKHLFGASIIINRDNKNPYNGFSKRKAKTIYDLIKPKIHATSQKGVADSITSAIKDAIGTNTNTSTTSIADELKKLKDLANQGVISEDEFNTQKQKLMNS
ncbi:hypothetical protein L21SP5_01151 [Salinivirga cyanobacteriivorans]|uniref:SHOCT domain-containing protein n=1 Tax=Salinivirga cyanobacteriivorans TaxID=1307839 RepID=A0A0S2HXP5_9BACT|nr:SHOCT domain-containing protein [Salinivirga cyanobacteriivorans]ALO14810.1 hypothetical protein L21SP5_01151 [Salinivirga cyanobacteriivorans]